MELSQEDMDKIVSCAVEKILLRIPEIIGNLIQNHAEIHKLNKDFYSKYPDFKTHRDSVQSVLHEMELENPAMEYEELLKLAAPNIKERIMTVQKLNTDSVMPRNKLDFKLSQADNGAM